MVIVIMIKDLETLKVVLQCYNIAFSGKKSDHIFCQGYLNLLLWKGKLFLCHLMVAIYLYSVGVCVCAHAYKCAHMNANAVMSCIHALMVRSFALAILKNLTQLSMSCNAHSRLSTNIKYVFI